MLPWSESAFYRLAAQISSTTILAKRMRAKINFTIKTQMHRENLV